MRSIDTTTAASTGSVRAAPPIRRSVRKTAFACIAMAGATTAIVASAAPSQAIYLNELAPSIASPWWYKYSFALTGYGYFTAPTHVSVYQGNLISDEYALDMTPTGGLAACGRAVYAGLDGMSVYAISSRTGGVYLRKTVNGAVYEEKLLHMTDIRVTVNQQNIGTKTLIGLTGATGTDSCHLHLAMHKIVNGTRYAVRPVICGREITVRNAPYPGC